LAIARLTYYSLAREGRLPGDLPQATRQLRAIWLLTFNKKLRPLPTDEGWKHTTTAVAESGSKFSSDVFFGKVGDSAELSTVTAFASPPLRKSKRKRKNERIFYQIL